MWGLGFWGGREEGEGGSAIGGQAVMLIAMQCVFAPCLQPHNMLGGQFEVDNKMNKMVWLVV